MFMANGSTHTVAVNQKGKLFSWGWNDCGQCAKDSEVGEVYAASNKAALISL